MSIILLLLALPLCAADLPPALRVEEAFDTRAQWRGYFSHDGRAYAVQSGGAAVFDTGTGLQTALIPWESRPYGIGHCSKQLVALSPDGASVLLESYCQKYRGSNPGSDDILALRYRGYEAEREGELELWDVASEKKLRSLHRFSAPCRKTGSAFQPHQCFQAEAEFSPNGKRVAFSLPAEQDTPLTAKRSYVVDVEGGRRRELKGYPFFARDGRLLSVAPRSASAEIRDEDADQSP